MKIVLVGYRGSGKTTVGKILSDRLSLSFVDTDEEIERAIGCSISEFVKRYGWVSFREVEVEVLRKVSRMEDVVVASGGGSFMNPGVLQLFMGGGWIFVYLRASPGVLKERIVESGGRPSLTGGSSLDEVELVLSKREPVYLSISHLVVETDGMSPEEVAQRIEEFTRDLPPVR